MASTVDSDAPSKLALEDARTAREKPVETAELLRDFKPRPLKRQLAETTEAVSTKVTEATDEDAGVTAAGGEEASQSFSKAMTDVVTKPLLRKADASCLHSHGHELLFASNKHGIATQLTVTAIRQGAEWSPLNTEGTPALAAQVHDMLVFVQRDVPAEVPAGAAGGCFVVHVGSFATRRTIHGNVCADRLVLAAQLEDKLAQLTAAAPNKRSSDGSVKCTAQATRTRALLHVTTHAGLPLSTARPEQAGFRPLRLKPTRFPGRHHEAKYLLDTETDLAVTWVKKRAPCLFPCKADGTQAWIEPRGAPRGSDDTFYLSPQREGAAVRQAMARGSLQTGHDEAFKPVARLVDATRVLGVQTEPCDPENEYLSIDLRRIGHRTSGRRAFDWPAKDLCTALYHDALPYVALCRVAGGPTTLTQGMIERALLFLFEYGVEGAHLITPLTDRLGYTPEGQATRMAIGGVCGTSDVLCVLYIDPASYYECYPGDAAAWLGRYKQAGRKALMT